MNDSADLQPDAEGYVSNTVVNNVNVYNYVFNYVDHLGNNRLSYTYETATSSIKILEENHYYPFGLKHTKYNINQANYGVGGAKVIPVPKLPFMYKYNGKELQDELGLNAYDYGARMYFPDAPHWGQIDPKAEEMRRWSPYAYAFDNPIIFVDPDGMKSTIWLNTDGNKVVDEKTGEYTKYATAQDKAFGDGLKKSGAKGVEQFNELVTSKTKTTVEFHQEDSGTGYGYLFGYTSFGDNNEGYSVDSNGNVDVKSAKIDIYIGTSERFFDDIKCGTADLTNASDYQKKDAEIIKDNKNVTPMDHAISTFGHEIDHLPPTNVKQSIQDRTKYKDFKHSAELTPHITGNKIFTDISNKKR